MLPDCFNQWLWVLHIHHAKKKSFHCSLGARCLHPFASWHWQGNQPYLYTQALKLKKDVHCHHWDLISSNYISAMSGISVRKQKKKHCQASACLPCLEKKNETNGNLLEKKTHAPFLFSGPAVKWPLAAYPAARFWRHKWDARRVYISRSTIKTHIFECLTNLSWSRLLGVILGEIWPTWNAWCNPRWTLINLKHDIQILNINSIWSEVKFKTNSSSNLKTEIEIQIQYRFSTSIWLSQTWLQAI